MAVPIPRTASDTAASRAGGSCKCADRSPACRPFRFSLSRGSTDTAGWSKRHRRRQYGRLRPAIGALALETLRLLLAEVVILHRPPAPGMRDCLLELLDRAEAEANRMPRLDIGGVPVCAVTHRGDCRLCRTD